MRGVYSKNPFFRKYPQIIQIYFQGRKNWANYNFEKEKDMNNDNINSLISEITITKSIKWNKTSFCIDILRFFVIIFFQIFFFYLSDNCNFYFYENNQSEYKINDAFLFESKIRIQIKKEMKYLYI